MDRFLFTQHFDRYACEDETIELRVGPWPLRFVARIKHDGDTGSPAKEDDGFWPSLDPKSDGYIGPKSETTLRRHIARAKEVLRAWKNDEWGYVNIDVRAYLGDDDDTPLTGEYDHCIGGVDRNYPDYWFKGKPKGWYPNWHLQEVANDCLYECCMKAFDELAKRVQPGEPGYAELGRYMMASLHGVHKPELIAEIEEAVRISDDLKEAV